MAKEKVPEILDPRNKLLEFQKRVQAITKDTTNPFFKSKYFDINSLLSDIKPLLNELGLTITQPIAILEGKNTLFTFLKDGDRSVESCSIILPDNINPQMMGSAITYYRRYCLQSMLALQAEDDDGNSATPPKKEAEIKPIKVNTVNLHSTKKEEPKPVVTTSAFAGTDTIDLLYKTKTLKELKDVWDKHKDFHKDPAFLEAKNERKADIEFEALESEFPDDRSAFALKLLTTTEAVSKEFQKITKESVWNQVDQKYRDYITQLHDRLMRKLGATL